MRAGGAPLLLGEIAQRTARNDAWPRRSPCIWRTVPPGTEGCQCSNLVSPATLRHVTRRATLYRRRSFPDSAPVVAFSRIVDELFAFPISPIPLRLTVLSVVH